MRHLLAICAMGQRRIRLVITIAMLSISLIGSVARADIDFPDIKADAGRYRARIVGQVNPADDVGTHLQAYKDAVRARRWSRAIVCRRE
jgi:hypothetical protein